MNREILFRGKRKDNGEWVYGNFVRGCVDDFAYIVEFGNKELCRNYVEVIPETVGQYTGLTDKNGKKIFEGDIVHCVSKFDNAYMVVIFECGQFRMVLAEKYYEYKTGLGYYDINCFTKEVIGNVYDNPELLEVGK